LYSQTITLKFIIMRDFISIGDGIELVDGSIVDLQERHYFKKDEIKNTSSKIIEYKTIDNNGLERFWVATKDAELLSDDERHEILDYCLGINNYDSDEIVNYKDLFLHSKFIKEIDNSEKLAKELALLTLLISNEDLFNLSKIDAFDKDYAVAKFFIKVFGLDNSQWDNFCYESYVSAFANRQVNSRRLRESFNYFYEVDINNSKYSDNELNVLFDLLIENKNDEKYIFEKELRAYEMDRNVNSKF